MTENPETAVCTRVDRLEDIPEPVPTSEFVVIDVIISSTSIVRLLEEGASYVKPFGGVEEALQFKRETDDAVLVGEDNGSAIEGFDLSPLPSVIADADIEGRPVGIRTSNGTRAMDRLGHPEGLLVGSTINAGAVAEVLHERARDSLVIAAGRQGEVVTEDTVGAELIEARYNEFAVDESSLETRLRESSTANWLGEIGFGHEVDALAAFDSSETVPTLEEGKFVPYVS